MQGSHDCKVADLPITNSDAQKSPPMFGGLSRDPERDLNPHAPFGSTEFKSVVSTNSTIRASRDMVHGKSRMPGKTQDQRETILSDAPRCDSSHARPAAPN